MLYRSSSIAPTQRRPGVILLVVMAMLALFASLALSFVFYADSEAASAQNSVAAMNRDVPDIDPEVLLGYFLSKFIYDDNDPYSAGRGWSLARSMYGNNPAGLNHTPFNGGGRATFAPPTTNDPDLGVPMFNMINYQSFWDPSQSGNKTLNFTRTPEFYGKAPLTGVPPPTYRFVGGANPPWTAYDTNSLFLAEMTADGNVLLPSFSRPWLQSPIGSPAAKYTSVFPDSTWNPLFYPLPDMDASGNHVKNLDFGPGMNDSKWMDWGFPIMTAADGKRYKALFAPLIVDQSNRLHLWAHGNNLGTLQPGGQLSVSNQGFGPPDVNLTMLPGMIVTKAVETKAGVVIMTTAVPHQLAKQSYVIIRNMPAAPVNLTGYNGMYQVIATPNSTTFTYAATAKGLMPYNGGANPPPTALSVDEVTRLYNLRYGGAGPGNLTAFPASWLPPMLAKGTWFSIVNANARDSRPKDPTFGMSSTSPYSWFQTTTPTKVAGAGLHTLQVAQISNFVPSAVPTPLPWGIEVGMVVVVNDGTPNNAEQVMVTAVNYAANPPTFTAKFTQKHGAPATVTGGYPGFPTYPASWGNASGTELAPNPLAFNLILPNPTIPPPLQMSHQEALLRWGGTNSPALTSKIFQLMPTTFSNTRARNMVTLASSHLDRVTSVPYLNFNSLTSPQYGYTGGPYPLLGVNEVQAVTVIGTPVETFTLSFKGQTTKPPFKVGAPAARVQAELQSLPTIGNGNVTVSLATSGMPPTYTYTITFTGTLGNVDVPQLTGASTSIPPATVQVKSVQNGAPLFAAPNFAAVPIQTPPGNSDFSADWRSTVSQLLRVDLTRPLTDYPAPAPTGLINPANKQYQQAVADRVQFATDIYHALVRVTGARDPNVLTKAQLATIKNTSPDYQAARWLAQLAVNIVDYIDDDDYMTPFPWNAAASTTSGGAIAPEYVFGTELPRLVLNEVYVQQEAATVTGQVNVWAELFNPFKTTLPGSTYPLDQGMARLQLTNTPSATPPYIIEIHESRPALTSALGSAYNPTGAAPTPPLATQTNWGTIPTTIQVPPSNGVTHGGTIVPLPPIKPAPNGATETKGVVTIQTMAAHGLTKADVGKAVTINNVPVAGYDGTLMITGVPSATTFTYSPAPGVTGMAPSGGGTATYVKTDNPAAGNNGFYVIGPANAQYATTGRAPNLPATYVPPSGTASGMSFTSPPANIVPAVKNGASHVGTTVTIQATQPLPPTFVVGESVKVLGVTTAKGQQASGYNNTLANPTWTITSVSPAANPTSFTYTVPNGTVFPNMACGSGTATIVPGGVTLLLRRLANPHVAYNATTNPYITVDYIDGVPVNTLAPANNQSVGRNQPYAANAVAWLPQVSPGAAPQNTFFSKNSNATAPPDWLVHLDRPPVNPIELLHVSGYRPHELTQQFFTSNGKFQHYAPWNPMVASPDPNASNAVIYRALDQMSTRYMAGLYTGGRFPGNINLNTITEPEIFLALCDPHDATAQYPNAWFKQADVANPQNPIDPTTVLGKLIASRNNGVATMVPTSEGLPFKSFSAATTVKLAAGNSAVSMNDSWFRPDPATGRPLFIPPSAAVNPNAHPYLQSSILQKIYNNITTTSNVFAVYWTVGFFEVVDESVKPARLGQEIGRSQNRHIRHRFFAIVDRTGMHLYDGATAGAVNKGQSKITLNAQSFSSMGNNAVAWSATQSYAPGSIVTSKGNAYFCTQAPPVGTPPTNTTYWQPVLQAGMLLNIDSGTPFAEVVTVPPNVSGLSFTANFVNNHGPGASVFLRGNPGPRTTYNPHDDSGVVLHMSVIK